MSMFRGIFRRSFTKHLLSYAFCLIFPLVIFSFLYKTIFLSAYSNQLVEKTAESIDYTFGNIDIQMNNLRHISSQIMVSRQFSDAFFEENTPIFAYFTVKNILKMYAITNEFIFDIWYFDRNRGYVYSPAHMVSLDSFSSYVMDYPDPGIISSAIDQLWLPETEMRIFDTKQPLLTYIAAYPNSVTHENSVLILLVRKDVFEQSLKSVIPPEHSTAAVIGDAGQIIYSLNSGLNQAVEKIIAAGGLQNSGTAVLKADNREYFAYVKKSPQNRLTYLSLISRQELAGGVQKYTMTFLIMILAIVFFGSALIFFLMKYNYSPLQKLIQYTREQFGNKTAQNKNMNDIDIIRTALKNISDENASLVHHIEKVMNFLDIQVEQAGDDPEHDGNLKIIASHDSILQYINDNYKKSDFSIQSVSDHFGISESNLSHQFKSNTGKNISAFIGALKLSYAKDLLSASALPVGEIAAKLGYFQASSFIRKFKATEGMTPGDYRAQHSRKG